MAKAARGRPPIPTERKRSKNFTFRGTLELHEKLRVEAQRAGVTVSDLIATKLEKSLRPTETFETAELGAIARLLVTTMQRAGQHAAARKAAFVGAERPTRHAWLSDAFAYTQAALAVGRVLSTLCPEGDKAPPKAKDPAMTIAMARLGEDRADLAILSHLHLKSDFGNALRDGLPSKMLEAVDRNLKLLWNEEFEP